MTIKKITFAEGAFDELVKKGMTQEQIDEIKAKIEAMAASGELQENSKPVSEEEAARIESRKPEPRH